VWLIPDAIDTVVCAPDDGWKYHPKHVEQFSDINKLCNIASCWIYMYIGILLGAHLILHISRIRVKMQNIYWLAEQLLPRIEDTGLLELAVSGPVGRKWTIINKGFVWRVWVLSGCYLLGCWVPTGCLSVLRFVLTTSENDLTVACSSFATCQATLVTFKPRLL
jgi:hypothetical protein